MGARIEPSGLGRKRTPSSRGSDGLKVHRPLRASEALAVLDAHLAPMAKKNRAVPALAMLAFALRHVVDNDLGRPGRIHSRPTLPQT